MPEPRISVLIVAKNEARNLSECLSAVSWADERVVVVDSSSQDATREIAESKADVVVVRAFDDFASQRNCALGAASGDWVLSIDADERVTRALADEIRRVISGPANPCRGFRVPIRSEILGRRFYGRRQFERRDEPWPLRIRRGFIPGTAATVGLAGEEHFVEPLRTPEGVALFQEFDDGAGAKLERPMHDQVIPGDQHRQIPVRGRNAQAVAE